MSTGSARNDSLPRAPVIWTLVALAVAAAPHLLAFPVQVALTIILILGFRSAAAWYQWKPLPVWLRLLITLTLVSLVAVSFGGLWGRRTATALLCVMMAAKTLEMYRIRDLRLVNSVCFFLIATQFLFNEGLFYFGYLIVGCWCSTLALLRIQRVRSSKGTYRDRPAALPVLLSESGRLLLISLPIALALFVLFPRLAQPLWGLPDDALDGKTGLSETMSPGSIATLFADDSPAFRVEFDSNQPPPPEQLYWRGPVLWNFNGSTWSPSSTSITSAARAVEIDDLAVSYEVQLEPHERRWLLAMDHPARTDRPRALLSRDYQLVSPEPITSLTAYRVISNPEYLDSPTLAPVRRTIGTRLPADRNPRTIAMAREWRQRYPDDRELAEALLQWFTDEPFFYSLDTQPLGRHSADEFLFDLRDGYCEYYASAFAIFMRAAGVPTRIVTGYQGGFWNETGQYLLVRQSDAHAWNEIWLEGEGWTRFDPTAAVSPLRIREGSAVALNQSSFFLDWPWVSDLRNRIDRLQHAWNQRVLGFDADTQIELLKRIGLPELRPDQLALLMILASALIGLPVALFTLRASRTGSQDPAQRAWQSLQRQIHRGTRVANDPSMTPMEWAQWIENRLDPGPVSLTELARQYERVRYGPVDDPARRRFIEQAKRFPARPLRLALSRAAPVSA